MSTILYILFYMPSIFVFTIYTTIDTFFKFRRGKIQVNGMDDLVAYMLNQYQNNSEVLKHGSIAFWIFIVYIIIF